MNKIVRSTNQPACGRKPLALAVAIAALASSPTALAQTEGLVLEEVVVTARKRTESLQDVPISIQALGSTQINELGITSFEDYAAMLPSVSFASIGPGTATIYMRGASDGGDGNASGSQPSVGVYLDEQPVTAIGAALDIHIYDIERIEALAGPQGTLYGASSQSGTLRIITKKPDASAFEAGFDVDYSDTSDGGDSYGIEGFVNIPLSDTAAIRLVGWNTEDGGWIDNVPGTRNYELEGGYGSDPDPTPGGRQKSIDNNHLVGKDQNEVESRGARAALRVDLSDTWVATVSAMTQQQDTEGAFDHDPFNNNDDQEIQRFYEDFHEDSFTQYALTLEGEIAGHSIIYAGTYMERDVDYQSDYTAYGEDAYWVPYYACDYYADANELCSSLEEYYTEDNEYERTSHELRLQSMGDGPLQYTAGLFYEENEHSYLQEWNQPGMSPALWARGKEGIFYTTDQVRNDEQFAIFGELTYGFTDNFRATFGVRAFDNTNELKGYTGWGPTNYVADYGNHVDSKTEDDDQIYKFNLTWDVTDNAMLYATYSEGYRVGGLNRDSAISTPTYAPDILTNYELGWKTTLLDGRLRFNGAAYFIEWEDMQYTIYEFALSPVANTYNIGEAEITGLEADFSFLVTEGLTLSGAIAYNDAETTTDFVLEGGTLSVPDGTELPNIPEIKYNLTARYQFMLASYDSYAQLAYSYTDESYNQIRPSRRELQDDFSMLNFRTGFNEGSWGVDFYVNNLTDENDNISIGQRPYQSSATTQRPRTVGVKFSMRFD